MIGCLPAFRSRMVLGTALAVLALFPARVRAGDGPPALPPSHETWDATTLDTDGVRQSLEGRWEFQPWSSLEEPPDFAGATRVRVPGHREPGAYRHVFTFTPRMPGTMKRLHFGAVGYRCAVFLNGERLGGHLGGFTPFEFDITEAIRPGSNELVVLVQGRTGTLLNPAFDAPVSSEEGFTETGVALSGSGARSVMGYGYFAFEGIRNEVHIREVPRLRMADAVFRSSFRDRRLAVLVHLANDTGAPRDVVLRLAVFPFDLAARRAEDDPAWETQRNVRVEPGRSGYTVEQPWNDPALWMPGDPHLYVGRLTLEEPGTGEPVHRKDVRFGFREVWTEGNRILINGVPFRAFVHGSLDTQASPARVRELMTALPSYHINTIRPSTMPPPPHFAQSADELGIALIGEGELTFNRRYAYEQPVFWQNFLRSWHARIARDKNHPSILLWSLANEVMLTSPGVPGLCRRFYESFRALSALDPTRPFMQEGDGDLRDHTAEGTGFPIDVINLHLYDVSPSKNPLWATEFPPVAWALDHVTNVREIPGTLRYGIGFPDRGRPWFIGEFGPAVLIAYPDHFGFWSGPDAYRDLFGNAEALVRGVGETMAMQLHAFRDLGMAGMDPWGATPLPALEPYLPPAMAPVLVFTRDRMAHGHAGERAERRFTVLNDSLTEQDLSLEIRLERHGEPIHRQAERFVLPPGGRRDTDWSAPLPAVDARSPVRLIASVSNREGESLSSTSQAWAVYPVEAPSDAWRNGRVRLVGDSARLGRLAEWSGAPIEPAHTLAETRSPPSALVVLDGASYAALDPAAHRQLTRYVEQGGVLLLLGADRIDGFGIKLDAHPLSESTRLFLQGSHALTAGTENTDWEFWSPDHRISRGNYTVPVRRGVRTLLLAGGAGGLRYSPLIVVSFGEGRVIASRLLIEQSIGREPMAAGFLNRAAAYAEAFATAPRAAPARRLALIASAHAPSLAGRLAGSGIPVDADEDDAFREPATHLLLADARSAPEHPDRVRDFVRDGGTLWLRRLAPESPWLALIAGWTGVELTLREPRMWLQQFEAPDPEDPVLEGITAYHTCWATFAWTHGDRYSLRTTPIAAYVLRGAPPADVLLSEPDWIGEWNSGPGRSTLAQEILYRLGTHTRNPDPGAGLVRIPLGSGAFILDQMLWDEAAAGDAIAIPDKARHILLSLWRNLTGR